MNSTKLWMTAQTPSAFGMPISGHAFATDTCARPVDVQGTAVRTAVAADQGLVQSYFPGTTAWRPPTC
jgi:hypothetical protein